MLQIATKCFAQPETLPLAGVPVETRILPVHQLGESAKPLPLMSEPGKIDTHVFHSKNMYRFGHSARARLADTAQQT